VEAALVIWCCARFKPELDAGWFSAMMEVINNVSLLSVILADLALPRSFLLWLHCGPV
jgi:hypothetical protein